MKIVADENMPKVAELFAPLGEVVYVNGRTLTNEQLLAYDADALLVRSVTKVNEELLKDTNIRFVGSATIGIDHIDVDYLSLNKIDFANAPGCNAHAVADYVMSALSYLYEEKGLSWLTSKISIIGYGNVGMEVHQRLAQLGCSLSVYDPFKAIEYANGVHTDKTIHFVDLHEALQSEVIVLHTPLTTDGDFPTQHMLNEQMLKNLAPNTSIINAGRGGVIDEHALMQRKQELGGEVSLIFDVWDNEPNINLDLMQEVDIATPHIAGYSLQGREKGSWMVYKAFCKCFDIAQKVALQDVLSTGLIKQLELAGNVGDLHLEISRTCHAIYNLTRDDANMRKALFQSLRVGNTQGAAFDLLRKHYSERDELSTCCVVGKHCDVYKATGFSI
ncbi:4-phosphoerythronate dehydrogenase [Marinomonas agarivorans]|nr:4-phosphoerythronate dehydrogenase [Marinomonas agarivorans]